jgi:Tfp pilus assembly protein PilV
MVKGVVYLLRLLRKYLEFLMSESSTPKKKKKAGFRLSTEIIVAILGLLGVGITGYFGYLQTTAPYRYSVKQTQTAEARLTRIALSATSTKTKAPPTDTPTQTATITMTPSNTPTRTASRTPSVTPTKKGRPEGLRYCVNAYSVNVRVGPSTQYGAIGNLHGEDCLYFDASNVEGTWLRISPNQPEEYEHLERGWIYIELLGLLENTRLPVITLTPTPTFTPTETYTPSPTLTPSLTPSPSPTSTPTTAG